MNYALETTSLSYAFSKTDPVLDTLNLRVPAASIYGFLGPNGAGKTTTLKLVLGLLKRQTGRIDFSGRPFQENRIPILQEVGSLIETPSLYGHLTAKENLEIWRRIYRSPATRIAEVLERVGLSDTGSKRTRQFSLGMKQRLGIAIALLNKPSLLILDEPTNGLDPNGMIEMRELLRTLNREEKMTILISSHLLSEIAKLVTHVGIINKGRLVFQDTLDELLKKKTSPADDLETIFMDLIKN